MIVGVGFDHLDHLDCCNCCFRRRRHQAPRVESATAPWFGPTAVAVRFPGLTAHSGFGWLGLASAALTPCRPRTSPPPIPKCGSVVGLVVWRVSSCQTESITKRGVWESGMSGVREGSWRSTPKGWEPKTPFTTTTTTNNNNHNTQKKERKQPTRGDDEDNDNDNHNGNNKHSLPGA